MSPPSASPRNLLDLPRMARLSRGLLMTLKSLSSHCGDDHWTGIALDRKLAIQRFYKDFDTWIREVESLIELRTASSLPEPDGPAIPADQEQKDI